MSNTRLPPPIDDLSHSIEELISDYLTRLTEKLQQGKSISELAEEAGRLNDLLISFKLRDELLERLLDTSTPEDRRQQIRATLKAQRMKVADNQAEMERLHERSSAILDKSARLIGTVQQQIDKDPNQNCGYVLGMCGFCEGTGRASDRACPVCDEKCTVLVYQPAVKCPCCKGNGRATVYGLSETGGISFSQPCVTCGGSGWASSVDKRE
jgi:hypothetical protein